MNAKYKTIAEITVANIDTKYIVDSILIFFATKTVIAAGPPINDNDVTILAIEIY